MQKKLLLLVTTLGFSILSFSSEKPSKKRPHSQITQGEEDAQQSAEKKQRIEAGEIDTLKIDVTKFLDYIWHGIAEAVAACLKMQPDLKDATNDGATPLYIAAQNGHAAVVNVLIAAGAEVNKARTIDGATPLYVAAQNNHANVVQILIAAHAEVNKGRTDNGATPLYIAAQEGHAAVANILIVAGAEVNQARTDDGATPLYAAAQQGHTTIVQELIAAGADVKQATTNDGTTPLHIAAQNGHAAIANVLIVAGAEVNQARTDNGATPLHAAAQQGHAAIANVLIVAGAEVNQARTDDGATPLYAAAQQGHAAIVHVLIAAGAQVNQATTDGATPLAAACYYNKIPIIKILLGIPTIERNFRNRPWYNTMRDAMTPETKLLVDNDWYGKNQKLFEAIRKNKFDEVSQAIKDMQQKIYIYDRWGIAQQTSQESKETKENFELYNTPLHVALRNYAALQKQEERASCLSIIKALSEADPQLWYIPNEKGITPLNAVLQRQKLETIKKFAPTKYYNKLVDVLTTENEVAKDIVTNIVQEYAVLTAEEREDANLFEQVEGKQSSSSASSSDPTIIQ